MLLVLIKQNLGIYFLERGILDFSQSICYIMPRQMR